MILLHTQQLCVPQYSIRPMFRVLGIYNFVSRNAESKSESAYFHVATPVFGHVNQLRLFLV